MKIITHYTKPKPPPVSYYQLNILPEELTTIVLALSYYISIGDNSGAKKLLSDINKALKDNQDELARMA